MGAACQPPALRAAWRGFKVGAGLRSAPPSHPGPACPPPGQPLPAPPLLHSTTWAPPRRQRSCAPTRRGNSAGTGSCATGCWRSPGTSRACTRGYHGRSCTEGEEGRAGGTTRTHIPAHVTFACTPTSLPQRTRRTGIRGRRLPPRPNNILNKNLSHWYVEATSRRACHPGHGDVFFRAETRRHKAQHSRGCSCGAHRRRGSCGAVG